MCEFTVWFVSFICEKQEKDKNKNKTRVFILKQ